MSNASDIAQAFHKSGLVPELIPNPPAALAEVTFINGLTAFLGNELLPHETDYPPKVHWEAQSGQFYTLAFVDPDAPSRKGPTNRDWIHWLVVNIPGKLIEEGEPIADYHGPAPPKDTGLHRYAILVYQQPGKITVSRDIKRGSWNVQEFAKQHGLGDPVAANFFLAKDQPVETAFEKSGLVPELIPHAPEALAEVTFLNGLTAFLGNQLTPMESDAAPKVHWGGLNSQLYSLVMVDPDAPSRKQPSNRDYLHWLVVNIPGHLIGQGDQVQEYQGPEPPKGTGLHRYAILVYQQPGEINVTGEKERNRWSLQEFAKKYQLGDPIAGNYFVAQQMR